MLKVMSTTHQAWFDFLKDRLFWVAFFLAPLVWLGLFNFDVFPHNSILPKNYWMDHVLRESVLFPVLEEWLFRGWLQGYLLQKKSLQKSWMGISLANGVTSFIFSLLHGPLNGFIWSLWVFIPSLIFGFFRDRFGQTQPSMLLHGFYNSGFCLLFHGVVA